MVEKLETLCVPYYLQLWIFDYLTGRSQYVRTSSESSKHITLNTGALQGCVLSPVLFVLYTNDLQMNNDDIKIIKYADDTAVVGLILADDCINYLDGIEHVNKWCQSNFLDLNVTKTKEMICMRVCIIML